MKKFLALILTLVLAACILSGCTSKPQEPDNGEASITITDMTGRTVEIPKTVEKIVPLGNAPRMITYLGLADKAVGIGGMASQDISPVTAYAYANKDLWADLPIVGTDAAGATDYYPEQIIALAPDVIFCSYTAQLADEIQTKTGVPTVAVAMGTLFAEDYEQALRLIAEVCGIPDRAEEVISFIDGCLEDLANRTADVPEEGKPTVLGAAATFKGAHGIEGVYSKYQVFEAIAANDVTTGISDTVGGVLIDKEQVLGWNPQYIFLDNGGVNLVKQDFAVMPDFYNQLQAVVNGDVYQYPSSTSYYSNVEIPIANSYYVASLLYPEEFKDINFEEKANEIFKFFLGADDYLSVLNEAGAGYGKVGLGE
ncbi:MAG: ABC transporter substrate-binding protein [Clostridiales bacterium]|nr:ABC transporter substrate-binding protein [Clostridiales bacterium]